MANGNAGPDAEHARWMQRAVDLSRIAVESGSGGPFGAVIVRAGRIVGEGRNRVVGDHDPTAHAEVVAIRDACARLGVHHLQGCVLYASCEPCPMCLASAYWAHLDAIWHACSRDDAAAIGFDDAFLHEELARPVEERRLPMHRLDHPGADDPMKLWARLDDRIRY